MSVTEENVSSTISSLKALAASIDPKNQKDEDSARVNSSTSNLTVLGAKRGDFFAFPLDLFEEEPGFNPRNYERPKVKAHIEKLAKAYIAGKSLPPLVVQVIDGRLIVRAGHCRRLAARLARERGAPIVRLNCIEMKGDEDAQDAMLITSQDSLDLTPIERARVYQRSINRGRTPDQIAESFNMSGKHVKEELELLELPQAMQDLVEEDVIKPYLARKLFRLHGGDKAMSIIQEQLAEQEDEGDDQQPLLTDTAPARKPRKITEKQLTASMPLKIKKSFAQTMFNGFSTLREHVQQAQPDAKDGSIQLKLPAEVFAELDKILAEIEKLKTKQQPSENGGAQDNGLNASQTQLAV